MFRFKFLGKTHVPHRKNTTHMAAVRMTPPAEILLPVEQHIGTAAEIVVKVGDEVKGVGEPVFVAVNPPTESA